MRSLGARVLLGAALWTLGLGVAASVGLALVWRHVPDLPVLGRTGALHSWVYHTGPALLVAALLLLAGFVQVRRGLAGLAELRARLAAVRDGRAPRVEGRYVTEVQPLVDDLNALVAHREQAVRRAVAKAGDLAHGLKTPLAVLAADAARVEAAGQPALAASLAEQVERMRRQVDYHLAHARAAASGAAPGARSVVRESVDGLARTLARLHADRGLALEVHVPPPLVVRVGREDLDEMLGNLLDNACRFARARVVVEAAGTAGGVAITVDDDGPGLPVEMREVVLARGARADEHAGGSGLGLAIAGDLAELHDGAIRLGDSPLGGLRVTLTLPA